MRVLHVLDHSVPLHSGYSFRTLAILKRAAAGSASKRSSSRARSTRRPARSRRTVDGFRFHRTRAGRGPLAERSRRRRAAAHGGAPSARIDELARTVRPDVLHAHSPVLDALPAHQGRRRRGIPVVYEVRAFWEDAAVDHGTSREWGLRYRAHARGSRRARSGAPTHVTTICEGSAADIVARGHSRGARHRDPERRRPRGVPPAAAARSGAPREARPRRARDRRVHRLVLRVRGARAARRRDARDRVARRPDVKLLLVGGGPEEDGAARGRRRPRVSRARRVHRPRAARSRSRATTISSRSWCIRGSRCASPSW